MTTDAEVIARFMEPPPTLGGTGGTGRSGGGWWFWDRHLEWPTVGGVARWVPMFLTLDRLHQVEARLTDEQWWMYLGGLLLTKPEFAGIVTVRGGVAYTAHDLRRIAAATPEQKIRALAAVLRTNVTDRLRNMTGDQAEATGRADWVRVVGWKR